MDESIMIEAHIRKHGVIHCPAVGSPELRAYEIEKLQKYFAKWSGAKRGAHMFKSEWGWFGGK